MKSIAYVVTAAILAASASTAIAGSHRLVCTDEHSKQEVKITVDANSLQDAINHIRNTPRYANLSNCREDKK